MLDADYAKYTESDYRYKTDSYDLYFFYTDMSIDDEEVYTREAEAYAQAEKLGCEDVFLENAKAPKLKRDFTAKDSVELLGDKIILKLDTLEPSDRLQMEAYVKEQAKKFGCTNSLVQKLKLKKAKAKPATPNEKALPSFIYRDNLGRLKVKSALLAEHFRENNNYFFISGEQATKKFTIYHYTPKGGVYKRISVEKLKGFIKAPVREQDKSLVDMNVIDNAYKDIITDDIYQRYDSVDAD